METTKYIIMVTVTAVHKESGKVAIEHDSVDITLPSGPDFITDFVRQLREANSVKEKALVVIYHDYMILKQEDMVEIKLEEA